jgi:hypothetical protein
MPAMRGLGMAPTVSLTPGLTGCRVGRRLAAPGSGEPGRGSGGRLVSACPLRARLRCQRPGSRRPRPPGRTRGLYGCTMGLNDCQAVFFGPVFFNNTVWLPGIVHGGAGVSPTDLRGLAPACVAGVEGIYSKDQANVKRNRPGARYSAVTHGFRTVGPP